MTIREPIDGRLVSLVPLSVTGAADWVRWMNDPETTRYLFGPPGRPKETFTLQDELTWGRRMLADPEQVVFGLREPGGRIVGNARLTPIGRGRASFGIVIGEADARGRGLGREATALICDFAFDRLQLREVVLHVDDRNQAGVHAYRAVGFEPARGSTMRLTRSRRLQLRGAAESR
ncbi:MAG: GNAT family N-acetyltransferase [Gaiellales bacterium]